MQSQIGTKYFKVSWHKVCLTFFHTCLAFSSEGRQVCLALIFGQSEQCKIKYTTCILVTTNVLADVKALVLFKQAP